MGYARRRPSASPGAYGVSAQGIEHPIAASVFQTGRMALAAPQTDGPYSALVGGWALRHAAMISRDPRQNLRELQRERRSCRREVRDGRREQVRASGLQLYGRQGRRVRQVL